MDMKAKSSLIRKFRKERMWSQEQLAKVSGLGLRTIQRLESNGSGSSETIRSLASVFEVEAGSLVWADGNYQVYQHKQWAIVILTFVFSIAALILTIDGSNVLPSHLIGVIFGLLVLIIVAFSSMTIEVSESEISWFFGPGLFKKRLAIEDVENCKKVRNPVWMGFGVHSFGTGWIYNVSGLLGVEIELKSGALIRLGTNEPNYLVQAISDAQDNQGS